jgi:hypothetical protein
MLLILAFLDTFAAVFMAVPCIVLERLALPSLGHQHALWVLGSFGAALQFLSGMWSCAIVCHMYYLLQDGNAVGSTGERKQEKYYLAAMFGALCVILPCLVYFGVYEHHKHYQYDVMVSPSSTHPVPASDVSFWTGGWDYWLFLWRAAHIVCSDQLPPTAAAQWW